MRYQNPPPDHSVNYTDEHPLKEFSQLIIAILVITLCTVALLTYFAGTLAKHIPFSYEQNMVSGIVDLPAEPSSQQEKLQALANRLSPHLELPDEMSITVHYDNSDTVNAFATLGGNIVIFEGLLQDISDEEELATVVAHEIAHVKLRHPMVAAGRGVTLFTLAAFFTGASSSTAGEWLIGSTINANLMQYSRAQELAADEWAARALHLEYGNISGAKALFERFADIESEQLTDRLNIELLRSHPYSKGRWQALQKLALQNGWHTQAGKPQPK